MIPSHDNFYDAFSKAKKIKIQWPDKARLAVSLVGNLEAWTEAPAPKLRRMRAVGGSAPLTSDELRCQYDFRTASENDYGGRTGVWRILRILKKYGVKGSFNTNGLVAARYPEAVKAVHSEGHEIVAHSYAEDIQLVLLSKKEEREEIRACVKVFQDLIGVRPYGWLSSGMRHTEHTLELLADESFLWHGDAVNDDTPYPIDINGKTIIEIPYRNAISGLNDTGMYRYGKSARDLLAAFKDEFDILYEEAEEEPKLLTLAMHCQMAFPATGKLYDEAIQYAKSHPDVWFARRGDIARWILENGS
ncbi:MAG: polysaccharide deacetylase family protein [Candidatus Binatia bacterium]|jgi:peptidoglycan/xylan/chitin deacetylase (PgdA/CDA1 family)|nr:polysaccharide deacetylase family protein [Candidatus Binatia bacterium]